MMIISKRSQLCPKESYAPKPIYQMDVPVGTVYRIQGMANNTIWMRISTTEAWNFSAQVARPIVNSHQITILKVTLVLDDE